MAHSRQTVAVVTGAGSGIGQALAVELGRRGAKLAVSDISATRVDETAKLLAAGGTEVHQAVVDVTDPDAVESYAAAVAERFGAVHQLYNNAGIAHQATLLESEYSDYERVLKINLWGVIHGTKAFLPHLIASGDGHLINVSSLNGYFAQEKMSHYCASKFAVRGFTEAIRAEMLSAGLPVKVSVVHPGGVKTNIANAALQRAKELGQPVSAADEQRQRIYNEKLLKMDPAQAARVIVDGVESSRARIIVGNDAKLVDILVRLFPSHAAGISVRLGRRLARNTAPRGSS